MAAARGTELREKIGGADSCATVGVVRAQGFLVHASLGLAGHVAISAWTLPAELRRASAVSHTIIPWDGSPWEPVPIRSGGVWGVTTLLR